MPTQHFLSILTTAGVHLEMLRRELANDESCASARAYMLVERLMQAQRAMLDELRPPDEWSKHH